MGIFQAIIDFFAGLLGNSAFVDSTHQLMTEMGASNEIGMYDAAVKTASELLQQGATLAQTIASTAAHNSIPEHHAAVIAAAAQAQVNTNSAAKAQP